MDAFSHALLGFILGQALGLDTNLQLVLIVSSVCLDIDALPIRGREAVLRTHRGPMHSILAVLLASLAITSGYIFFMRLPATIFLSVISMCLAGLLSHLLLDLSTTGGFTLLWPFSKKNMALGLTHFIDPTVLGTLVIAALVMILLKAFTDAIWITTVAVVSFLILISVVRYYERNAATKIIKALGDEVAAEIISLPTPRPDIWWTTRKTPFENGYRYEVYRVDSVRRRILGKDSIESPYTGCTGPVEPPIDSPLKAVAFSRRDSRIGASIDRFLLPAVKIAPSLNGETWQVLWYDAFAHVSRGERREISVTIKTDGTLTVDTRWTRTT